MTGRWLNNEVGVETEQCLFVYGISGHHAERFARRYEQDTYVYSGPKTESYVHQVDLKNGRTVDLSRFHARTINKSWSETRGWSNHAFVFDSWSVVDGTHINVLLARVRSSSGA